MVIGAVLVSSYGWIGACFRVWCSCLVLGSDCGDCVWGWEVGCGCLFRGGKFVGTREDLTHFSIDLAKVATNEKYFRTFRMQGIFLTTSCVCSGYCAAERVFGGDNTS